MAAQPNAQNDWRKALFPARRAENILIPLSSAAATHRAVVSFDGLLKKSRAPGKKAGAVHQKMSVQRALSSDRERQRPYGDREPNRMHRRYWPLGQ